jgi:hypothetical protein
VPFAWRISMLTLRPSHFASVALGLAAAKAIVPVRDVAAQARPRLEPRVAYNRLDSLETVALTGATFRERLDAVTTITSIALGERIDDGNCVGGPVLSVIKYPGLVSRLSATYQGLEPVDVRVIGSLIEKEFSTPDHYPLS